VHKRKGQKFLENAQARATKEEPVDFTLRSKPAGSSSKNCTPDGGLDFTCNGPISADFQPAYSPFIFRETVPAGSTPAKPKLLKPAIVTGP
jgi:hypothetical protein